MLTIGCPPNSVGVVLVRWWNGSFRSHSAFFGPALENSAMKVIWSGLLAFTLVLGAVSIASAFEQLCEDEMAEIQALAQH